jgi:hypothetical protein
MFRPLPHFTIRTTLAAVLAVVCLSGTHAAAQAAVEFSSS